MIKIFMFGSSSIEIMFFQLKLYDLLFSIINEHYKIYYTKYVF